MFESDLKHSTEYTYEQFKNRSLWERTTEWLMLPVSLAVVIEDRVDGVRLAKERTPGIKCCHPEPRRRRGTSQLQSGGFGLCERVHCIGEVPRRAAPARDDEAKA